MKVKIEVSIAGVDGETNVTLQTPDAGTALNFTRTYDHEGSSMGVTIEADHEHAYRLLELINESQRPPKAVMTNTGGAYERGII
jgi:hypothetical protein